MVIFPDNPEVMTHFVRCIEVKSNLVARCRYFVRCDGIAGPWPGAEQALLLAEQAPPGSLAAQPTGRAAAPSRRRVSSFNKKTRNTSETFAGISGHSEPPVGIEPTTYSLRVNRSAD